MSFYSKGYAVGMNISGTVIVGNGLHRGTTLYAGSTVNLTQQHVTWDTSQTGRTLLSLQ